MIYRPRKVPTIKAFKFSIDNADDTEVKDLGIEKVYEGYQGVCSNCGRPMNEHGLYRGRHICPGYYVVYEGRTVVNLVEPDKFESIYRPMVEPKDIVAEIDYAKEER